MSTGDSKTCTKCGETKRLDDFPRDSQKSDDRRSDCKLCHSATVRGIYHRDLQKSRERNNNRQRQYYADDPEKLRERARQFKKTYAKKNREWSRRWAAANPEKARSYKRKYEKANPEKRRDLVRKRRAMRVAAFIEDVAFDDILRRDLGICGICSNPIMDDLIELDHIVPLAAGGWHERSNVQLSHRTCNRKKHAKVNFTLAD